MPARRADVLIAGGVLLAFSVASTTASAAVLQSQTHRAAAVVSQQSVVRAEVTAHHKKHHHKKRHHHKRKHHKKATPAKAARTTPTASEIQAAIAGLKQYVHTLLSPTASQVNQFGDMVCTAFDNGQTATQIKAQILQEVKSLPFTTVLPGAADYVVTTAVKLYCPGYKSKLSS